MANSIDEKKKNARDITMETKDEIKGSLDRAVKLLQSYRGKGEDVCLTYLGHKLYSIDITYDSAYREVMGITRDEWLEEVKKERNSEEKSSLDNVEEEPDMDEIMEGVVDIEEEFTIGSNNSPLSGVHSSSIDDTQLPDDNSETIELNDEEVDLPKEEVKVSENKVGNTKKRVDSRNNGVKISKQLEEKLGKYNTDTVDYLVRFESMLEAELSLSSCSEEMRKAISEKMVGLTDLVAKIYKVTKSHDSNDKKKEKLEELVGDLDILKFTVDLRSEINATKETLIKKAKEVAKDINNSIISEAEQKQENITGARSESDKEESTLATEQSQEEKPFNPATDTPSFKMKGTSLTSEDQKMLGALFGCSGKRESFNSENEKLDVDKLFEVEDDFEELEDPDKLFEVEADNEEKGLIKHEKVGFFGKIKRFFSNIKEAYNRGKEGKDVTEFAKEVRASNNKPQKKSPDKNKGEYTKAGFSVMGKIKSILNEAIEDKSGREVTPNIIENIAGRIATFSCDKKIAAMCKGIVKDVWEFTNAVVYNVGDYVVTEGKKGIDTIRNARNKGGMDR